jgi:glycosyltransferase involved in cell wall biosynthesis
MHNVIPHERRIGDEFLSRLALSGSRFFILLSRNEEAEMKRLFPKVSTEDIHFTPLPLFNSYPKFSGSKEDAKKILRIDATKVLLFFGFVRDYKGLDVLIEACPKIFGTHPDAKLIVAGEFYGGREKYEKQIQSLNLNDKILIHDRFISEDEVGIFFAAADCAVLPYRSATQSAVIAAAYALDMPVITTDVGGLKEVVIEEKTGLVVPPENPDALADAVNAFYDLGGRGAFEEHVRQEAKKFSWE